MNLSECFSQIPDPRRSVGLRIDLNQLLSMVTLSYLCGGTGYRPVARFCKVHSELLTEVLLLRHGVPSHVTFREILMNIDQPALIEAFNSRASQYVDLSLGDWVSGDGKTLCSTVSDCHGKNQDFQAVVSIFGQQSGLIYAVEEYHNKSKEKGEMDVLRFLIDKLSGMGITLTVDALHTQKKRLKPS